MKVTRYNYASQFGDHLDAISDEIKEMLACGKYILTEHVSRFERNFGAYVEAKHVTGVNSGTDALFLALKALGVGPGDEVITQANTFHATVAAIRLVGAKPVLVDAEEDSYLMDQSQLADTITTKTRVILPVHLYGKPTPMDALLQMAAARNIAVVEDAAQAHGARIGGKRVGSLGELGCFSFHPSKNLAAAGDGGAVVTNEKSLHKALSQLRALGQAGQNHHVAVGLNSKLDAIQALVLDYKLSQLDLWNEARRRVAAQYRDRLKHLPVSFQRTDAGEEHVYHLFQIRTHRRDALMAHLQVKEVDATVRYPCPINMQPAFADQHWSKGQFPVAERLANELLALPIRPDMTADEIDYVGQCCESFFGDSGA